MKKQTVKNPSYGRIKVKPEIDGMIEFDVLDQCYEDGWRFNKFTVDVDAIIWFRPDYVNHNNEKIELTEVHLWNTSFHVKMPYPEFKKFVKRFRTKGL